MIPSCPGKSGRQSRIQSILPMISPEEFPEIYVYLSSLPGIDKAQKPDDLPMPFEIANSILSMDRPGELPKDLVDIITDDKRYLLFPGFPHRG